MKIEYQDTLVAFIDVLGFSNLVYSESIEDIQNYFNYILTEFEVDLKDRDFTLMLISDSIVIAARNDRDNLLVLIKTLSKLQSKLLTKKLLIRGAVSAGNLYMNKSLNIIVGPALIDAYQLELKAKYPRIIIDRKVILRHFDDSHCFRDAMPTWIDHKNPDNPEDNFHFIDYTQTFILIQQENILGKVFKWLKTQYYTGKYADKYDWVIRQMVRTMSGQIDRYDQLVEKTPLIRRRRAKVEMFLNLYKKL